MRPPRSRLAELMPAQTAPGEDAARLGSVFVRMMFAGIALVVPWLAFPHGSGLHRGVIVGMVAAAIPSALLIKALRRRIQWRGYSLMMAVGVGVLAVAIHFSGGPLSPLLLFYLWVVAFAGWYLPPRHLWLHVLWIVVSYGLVLLAPGLGKPHWPVLTNTDVSRWVLLSGTVTATGYLMTAFRRYLMQEELRWRVAFARSSTPVALAGLDHLILEANDAFQSLLGRQDRDLRRTSLLELVHPDDRSGVKRLLEHDRSPDSQVQCEHRLLHGDGAVIWVDLAASVIADPHGRPLYYFVQALDITARRESQARLARQAVWHTAVAELGRATVKGTDVEALSRQVTVVACDLLGCDVSALLERRVGSPGYRVVGAHGSAAATLVSDAKAGAWPLLDSAMEAGEPVVVTDWGSEARIEMNDVDRRLQAASGAAVVVHGHQRAFGVLMCESREPSNFDEEGMLFLSLLANLLAETIEHRRVQEQAVNAALHDPLTGLPNRVLFADLLRHSLNQSGRVDGYSAVFLIDLDGFSVLNDDLGHDAGDKALREVAKRFASVGRASDILARFADDEFVVLWPEVADDRAAARSADRLLHVLEKPMSLGGEEVVIRATAGIAIADGAATAQALLRDAEAAMRRAKERSRGGYELFDREMDERNRGRLRSENALRRAIGSDELSVVYQPIVDLEGNAVYAAEALLRWYHPDWGPVSPLEFIPIAEASGMIIPIGRMVLTESVGQLATWSGKHMVGQIAVNLSPRQIHDDALVDVLERTLGESGVEPSTLILELTENALISDSDWAGKVLDEISHLGVRLALDDYGTGYASLSYLSRYPFDVIKLDRTLIRRIEHSRKDQIIVASTVEMSHALGLKVVAEGVETIAQDATVRALGCDLGQGYFYARPLPPAEMEAVRSASPIVTASAA